jgi:hypothetical protein
MEAINDVYAMEWSCSGRSRDVNVEVADNLVAMVEVFMVDVVLILVDLAVVAGDAKNYAFFWTEMQSSVVEEAPCKYQRVHSRASCRCERTRSYVRLAVFPRVEEARSKGFDRTV